ncbi:MAG: hypothetical protein GY793_06495 [Proteobacteria bacterium]|nr:hypothetical protein [Pseudomonadota bacterium]
MFIDGAYRVLYLDIKDGNGFLPVGCLESHSFNENTETIDSTTRDNAGWNSVRLTNQSYSISFNGLVLENDISFTKQTYYSLKTVKRNRTLIDWKVDDEDYGSGYIIDLSDENGIDENVSFSSELIGQGEPLMYIDYIYNNYYDRVIADSGSIESEKCLKNYIDSIL